MFSLVGMKMGGFGTGEKHDQICCMKKILNEEIMEMIKEKRKKTSS